MVIVFAVFGLDPIVNLFVGVGGIGTIAVIFSQVIVSVAIFVFFRRTGTDRRVWHTVVAPLVATAALGTILVLALRSLDLLLGVTGATAWALVSVVVIAPALGIAYGAYLRATRPDDYARLDQVLTTEEPV